MQITAVTKAQIDHFLSSVVSHYAETKVLTEYERVVFANLFQAFLDGNILLLAGMLKVYEKAPEDCLLIMAAFTQVFGSITNDYSSYYSYGEGLLHIHAQTRRPERRAYVRATGEERHSLKLYLDERAPTGYRHCPDDRFVSAGAGNGHSGAVSAAAALGQLVRVFEEGLAFRLADGRENRFDPFDLSASLVSQHKHTCQFVKDKRAFEIELVQAKSSRNAISYVCWRWENRAKLKRFGL